MTCSHVVREAHLIERIVGGAPTICALIIVLCGIPCLLREKAAQRERRIWSKTRKGCASRLPPGCISIRSEAYRTQKPQRFLVILDQPIDRLEIATHVSKLLLV